MVERLHTQFQVHKILVSSRNASTLGLLQLVKRLDQKFERRTTVSVRKVRRDATTVLARDHELSHTRLHRTLSQHSGTQEGKDWKDVFVVVSLHVQLPFQTTTT